MKIKVSTKIVNVKPMIINGGMERFCGCQLPYLHTSNTGIFLMSARLYA